MKTIFQKEASEMFDLYKKKKKIPKQKSHISPTMHNTSIMIISFFHTGNINNVRIGAQTQGKICKKIIFPSVVMYILSNYDRRGAICVRLLTQNCLGFSHVCHGSHKSYSCKDKK